MTVSAVAGNGSTSSQQISNSVDDSDFMHLGKYEAITRVATAEGISHPLTMNTLEPLPRYGSTKAVRRFSREKYGRPVRAVSDEIYGRRRVEKAKPARRRPKISGEGW